MEISTMALVWYSLGWAMIAGARAVGVRLTLVQGILWMFNSPINCAIFIIAFPILALREAVRKNQKNQYLWRSK